MGIRESGPSRPREPSGLTLRYGLALAGVLALTVAAYHGALDYDFLYWDDRPFLHDNPNVQGLTLDNVVWMFTDYGSARWHYNYQPLTWLSHAVAFEIWGLDARPFRAINIALHGMNTVAVFVLATLLIGAARAAGRAPVRGWRWDPAALRPALLAAALFALHPQHVESVVWIAERKDLLYAFFFLLSLICYLRSTAPETGRRWLGFALVAYLLAALAKPMAMTLPGVLLLLDLYPLRRLPAGAPLLRTVWPLVREKLVFFTVSLAIAVISLIAQSYGGALPSLETIDLATRLLNAAHSLVFYLQTLVVPVGLSPFYPYPEAVLDRSWPSLVAPGLVVAATAAALVAWARGRPVWIVAWLYYAGTLVPVLGIVQVGGQAAADRYTYLPTLSIYLLVAVGMARLWNAAERRAGGWIPTAALALVFVALAGATRAQTAVWRTDETLWRTVLARFPDRVPAAYQNLGNYYFVNGDPARAIEEFKKGLALAPRFAALRLNLGYAYERRGERARAVAEYERGAADAPRSVSVNVRVGDAMLRLARLDAARTRFLTALDLEPGSPDILTRLGQVAYRAGRLAEAEREARRALAGAPDHLQANLLLAVSLHAQGKRAEAARGYRRVLALDPGNRDARLNLETLAPGG